MTVAVLPRTIPKLPLSRLLQASGAIDYRFDELGIEIEASGFSAGSFNGVAEVTYWNDAEEGLSWFVHDITLDCSKWNGKSWDPKQITLEQSSPLYLAIWSELTDGSFKDSVDAKVQADL